MAFFIAVETHDLIDILVLVLLLLFLLLDLCCIGSANRDLLLVLPFLVPFFFLFLRACSKGLLALARDGVGLVFFTLGFSGWEFLVVVPWVCTFETVLLKGR